MSEVVTTDETSKKKYREVVFEEAGSVLRSDIMIAYNEAARGRGRDRGDGRYVVFAHPYFFGGAAIDSSYGPLVDSYFNHRDVRDHREGDRTLEGTEWVIVTLKKGLSKGVEQVDIVMPKVDQMNSLTLAGKLSDPEVLKQYIVGVETYAENRNRQLLGSDIGFGIRMKDVDKSRHLAAYLENLISREDRKWTIFTSNDASKNGFVPEQISGFNIGDTIMAEGEIKPRNLVIWKLRYGKNKEWGEEPFLYLEDKKDDLKVGLVTDDLNIDRSRKKLEEIIPKYSEVLSRLPGSGNQKDAYAFYTRNYLSTRPGFATKGIFVFQEIYDKGFQEKLVEHEMVHALTFRDGCEKCSWLTEGLAMYLGDSKGEIKNLDFPEQYRSQMKERINEIGKYLVDDGLFEYYGGQLLVAFLEDLYGREFVFDFYNIACETDINPDGFSDKEVLSRAVEMSLPLSFDDFTANFTDWVKTKL